MIDLQRHNERTFFDTYSATGQREASEGSPYWRDEMLGLLRLDSIASRTIVVPDTHLFDGTYFLDREPIALNEDVGRGRASRQLPIEIFARRENLSDALAELLVVERRPTLNYFPFNSIGDETTRFGLAQALSETGRGDLDAALRRSGDAVQGVTLLLRTLLRSLGFDPDVIEPTVEGWRRWIEFEPHLRVTRWQGDFEVGRALDADPFESSELFTDIGREMLSRVKSTVHRSERQGHSTLRGDISRTLRELEAEVVSEEEALDLRTVASWYTQARHRAIALQDGANLGATLPLDVRPVTHNSKALEDLDAGNLDAIAVPLRVELPEGFLERIAGMSGDAYANFCHESRDNLEHWWAAADVSALRRAVDAAFAASEYSTDAQVRPSSSGLTQLFAPVVGASVGAAAALVTKNAAVGTPISAATTATVAAAAKSVAKRPDKSRRRRVVEYLQNRSGVRGRH